GMGGTDVSKGKQKKRKENLELKMKEKTMATYSLVMYQRPLVIWNKSNCSTWGITTSLVNLFQNLAFLTLCKYLKILGIQSNPLNDLHSASLGNLSTSLEKIDASASQIKSKITPGIGNLSNLVDLYLNSNEFIGPIPSALGRLVKLQRLEVQYNNL
ncbi:receptor-like protein 35, partial [Quercus suber]